MLNTSVTKVRDTAVTLLALSVGLMFISWGVAAIAAAPVIGGALVIIGVAMVAYSIWTSGWFGGSNNSGSVGLENIV